MVISDQPVIDSYLTCYALDLLPSVGFIQVPDAMGVDVSNE